MRNIALDLGATSISYSEARGGKIIARATVRSLSSLADRVGPNTPRARVLFEACREGWRVHDWLKASGHDPVMLDTTRAKTVGVGQHKRKNDRIDADVLALALERGSVPVAHVLSEHRRELRYQLSVRRALIESRAQQVALMREIARARGHRVPSCAVEDFETKFRATKLDEATRLLLQPLSSMLPLLNEQIDLVDRKLEQLCQEEPVITQLMTAPGVGPIVAAAFVSVVDEARRFRNAHQVEAYIGLVPSEDSSGGRGGRHRRIGAITKQGNSYLRAMLIQAAWSIMRLRDKDDPLKVWAEAVASRRGKRIAVVALARRLAGVLWAMWRKDALYDPGRLAAASAQGTASSATRIASRAALLAKAAKKFPRARRTRAGKEGNVRR
jgi:transposase